MCAKDLTSVGKENYKIYSHVVNNEKTPSSFTSSDRCKKRGDTIKVYPPCRYIPCAGNERRSPSIPVRSSQAQAKFLKPGTILANFQTIAIWRPKRLNTLSIVFPAFAFGVLFLARISSSEMSYQQKGRSKLPCRIRRSLLTYHLYYMMC